MWYMYTMEYSSVIKNIEIMPLAPIWMDMEIIILREVKEKDKYSIVWKVKKKKYTNELIYRTETDSQT